MIARVSMEAGSSEFSKPVRRRYDLHPPGLLFVFTSVFLAIGAFNSQNNLLFWAFGVAVGAVVVSGIVSGLPLMSLQLAREPVARGQVGHLTRLSYRIANRSRWWPVFGLLIEEQIAGDRGSGVSARTGVAHAGPHETISAHASVLGLNRGRYALKTIVVSSTFPFGLIRKSLFFEQPAVLVVRPTVAKLRGDVMQAVQSPGLQSQRSRNRAGQGDEFFGLREYASGDPMRKIAWKASARSQTLVVKQTMTPAPPRIWIGLDKPPAGASAMSLESAVSLIASLATHADQQGLSPGVVVGWLGFEAVPAEASASLGRLLDALAELDLNGEGYDRHSRVSADVTVGFGSGGGDKRVDGSNPQAWAEGEVTVFVPQSPRVRWWHKFIRWQRRHG